MRYTVVRHRLMPGVLAVLLLWVGQPGLPWCASRCAAGGAGPVPVPVVLIAESETASTGEGLWDASGLVARLEQEGYLPGASLFTLCPGVFQDFSDGSAELSGFVNACIALSPGGEVDVIACGVSGLVVRLGLESGLGQDGGVRNLIMVSSPNRGTFAADLLRSLTEIVKHESLFEEETRAGRYLPFGDEGPTAGGPKSLPATPNKAPDSEPVTWEDETSWVAGRVKAVYEPLYAKYVEERFLALPYVPAESPKETFAGWVRRTMPDLWKDSVAGGTLPPASGASLGLPSNALRLMPSPGSDLTTAHYEVLAMEVARNQYTMRLASKGGVVDSVFKPAYFPSSWKDALAHYGLRILGYYARKALLTVKAEVQEFVARRLVSLTGYLEDPAAPMLRRLVKDDLLVNLGTSSVERFERLPANFYLTSLNRLSEVISSRRKTRYVSIAAKLVNLWSLIWPQLGPNDLFLEVDSSVAPPSLEDQIAVFPGFVTPSKAGLLGDSRAQGYIVSILAEERPAVSKPGAGGRVTLSSWKPSYVAVGPSSGLAAGSSSVGPSLDVDVALPDPPEGWHYVMWTQGAGEGIAPAKAGVVLHPRGGTYAIRIPSDGLVGLRLARAGPGNPVLSGTVGSAWATEVRVSAFVSLGSAAAPAQAAPPPVAPTPNPARAPSSGDSAAGNEPAPSGPPASAVDVPMVRAVYRTKRTTLYDPSETYHERWKVDFGDGTSLQVQGSPALTISHVFAETGTYRVRAVSYGNRGEELVTGDWPVEVAGETDATRQFTCTSIARAAADMTLAGPKMWVTGKPARYQGGLRIEVPAGAELVSLKYDPGQEFDVLWERAGDFTVSCAAVVKLRYLLEGRAVTVEDVFVREMTVTVLTTGITR